MNTHEKLYEDIIRAGKHSAKFEALAQSKDYKGEKYGDKDNLKKSGAVSLEDAQFLYNVISYTGCTTAIEIGTWFGTSAIFMAKAMRDAGEKGKVYTCDKHNVYLEDNPYADMIEYNNMWSDEFLKQLVGNNVSAQFMFIDATIKPKDVKRIKMVLSPLRFALHDWKYGDRKGHRCYEMMRGEIKKKMVKERPTDEIAYFCEVL